jgi:hypothetical protein
MIFRLSQEILYITFELLNQGPYGTRADFPAGPAQWNPSDMMWYPMVPITPQTGQHIVHQATPFGSPSTPTMTPINPVYLNPQTSAMMEDRQR